MIHVEYLHKSFMSDCMSPNISGGSTSPAIDQTSPDVEAVVFAAAEAGPDYEPRMHRLQRQDAKSRKTFKIKRHRSTIKGNIIRSATVKGTLRV